MRRLALVLTVPLLALPADSASAAKRTCAMKGTKTVAANRHVRTFTRTWTVGWNDPITRLYGCLHSVNRRVLLDTALLDEYTSDSFGDVAVNGRYVAWRHLYWDGICKAACDPDHKALTWSIRIADLRTRQQRSFEAAEPRRGSLRVTFGGTATWLDDPTGEPLSQSIRR